MKKVLLFTLALFAQPVWAQTIENVKVIGATASPAEVTQGMSFSVSFNAKNFKCPNTTFKVDFIQTGSLTIVSSFTLSASPVVLKMPANAPIGKLYQVKVSSVRPGDCRLDPIATGNLLNVRAVKADVVPDEPDSSPGEFTISGIDETKFNPNEVTVTVNLTGAQFSNDPTDLDAFVNDKPTQVKNVVILPGTLSFTINLVEGLNIFFFHMLDKQGLGIEGTYKLWSGSQTLIVNTTTQTGTLISDALVKATLSDNKAVIAQGQTINGSIVFPNVPNRTLIVTASTADNLFGSAATVGGSTINIKLSGFKDPSPINNNDFSLGTQGWDTGIAPVTIIQHQEESAKKLNILALDQDMKVATSGEGPQTVSRTFITKKGTKNVTVRYQFITSEVPGGFFGSKFNDYYRVTARSQKGNTSMTEENSMNGLGLGAFNFSTGAIAFRELSLPVSIEGDVVQVDILVANVADGLYDSNVIIDFVEERQVTITKKKLIDPDQQHTLTYLSIDNHSYFSGNVRIYGQITVEGPAEDKITALRLLVYQGETLINSADLENTAQATLFQPFGDDEKVEISTTSLLFNLPSHAPLAQDGEVLLKLQVETEKSKQAVTVDYGSFANMALAKGLARYSNDDDPLKGGDEWGLPSMLTYIGTLPGDWSYNDISNMNGNVFPPHGSHQNGIDVDAYFAGYNARNAAVAKRFIDFLNTPAGSGASIIYVAFEKTPTDSFWQTIKDATANDGRKVTDVIQRDMGHTTHFHVRKGATAAAGLVALNNKVRARQAARESESIELVQVYPNPFVLSQGSIFIKIPTVPNTLIEADIHNLLGQSVKRITAWSTSEQINLTWDGSTDNGQKIIPGIYLIKIQAPDKPLETKKVILTY